MKKFFFKSNDSFDIEKNCEYLIKEIDKSLLDESFKKWSMKINTYLDIPLEEINFFVKKNIFNAYDFKNNKLKKKMSFFLFPIYLFMSFVYFVIINIFRQKKIKDVQNFHLLIDDLKSQRELNRYKKLVSLFKENCIAIRKSNNSEMSFKNCFVFYQKRFIDYKLKKNFLNFFMEMIKLSFILSFKLNINFLYIFLNFLDDYLFYDTLFSKFNFKYLLTHTHYNTDNIKNYLLKSKCNGVSTVIQKNINSKNQTSFFYHADVIFTYSDLININKNASSKINKQVSIGSFFMEYYYYTKPSHTKEYYDIMCLGGNEHYPNSANDRTKYHRTDYIEHLNWLIKISKEYPNLSIGFMHHANNKNNFEKNFLNGTNIKIINQNKNSYEISNNSKLICSWASSMVIELLSLEKNCFYLDPGFRNHQFLGNIDISYNLRIKSYENFKDVIKNLLIDKKNLKTEGNDNLKNLCLNSENCSQKIYEFMN